jgi:hypothetical protein
MNVNKQLSQCVEKGYITEEKLDTVISQSVTETKIDGGPEQGEVTVLENAVLTLQHGITIFEEAIEKVRHTTSGRIGFLDELDGHGPRWFQVPAYDLNEAANELHLVVSRLTKQY